MKISDQQIKIAHYERDEKGDKVEPEEQPAQKVAPLPANIQFARPNFENPGPPVPIGDSVRKDYPASIAADMTAGEVAQSFVVNCMNCKAFDPEGFQKYLKAAEARNDKPALVEMERAKQFMIQAGVVSGKTAKELHANADIALRSLGQCKTMTDVTGVFQATHPLATCELFQDKNVPSDVKRESEKKRDAALRMAQGKKA